MLDRRSFIRTAGGMAALGALAPSMANGSGMTTHRAQDESTDRTAKPRPGLKKAVKYYMVQPGETVLEKFELLKSLGFDGIELDAPSGLNRQDVMEATERTGLPVHGVVDSVHWSKPFSHPDSKVRAEGVAALEQAIDDAHAYGATSVLVVPAVVNKGVSYADAWDRSIREISQVLPLAEERGIRIAFENVWNHFLLSPLEAARYVDAFESDHVGWYFDVGNIVNYGWPEQWIRILGKRLFKLDIKEFSRKKRDEEGLWKGFNVPLLEGDCDWPAVMAALDDIGYEGWGTAEIGGGDRAYLADVAQRMDRIFAS